MTSIHHVCKFNQSGYCKFKNLCRNQHINEVCVDKNCVGSSVCSLRHPHPCKYFTNRGYCKFGSTCAYIHTVEKSKLEEKMENLENEMKKLSSSLDFVQSKLKELDTMIANSRSTKQRAVVTFVPHKGNPPEKQSAVSIPQFDGEIEESPP